MWKIVVGFVLFAAVALWVINKGGDSLDMSGEKHDVGGGGSHAAEPAATPTAPASVPAAVPAASAASA
ncbi:MAG: hypothetical protein C4K60_10125 [Ideonella sp. MAG2]|nr:MAG: hypothetical protein C4K60_10125 [Ideonella sp. MAG2]